MDAESMRARYTAPYVATCVCAGAGVVLHLVSGSGGLALAVLVLAVVAVVVAGGHAVGRPVAGVDRAVEVVFVAWVLAALAGWTAAAGTGSWPAGGFAAAVTVGVCAGWAAYGPWQRVAGLSVAAGVIAAVIAAAFLNPLGPGGWVRWAVAWWVGTTCGAVPYWWHAHVRQVNEPTEVDVTALTAAVGKHTHCQVAAVDRSLNVGEHGAYSIRYRLSDGRTAQSVQVAVPAVESELGLRPGAVTVEGSRHRRDEVTVSVIPVEPTTTSDMPDLPTSITQPAPLGRYDDGRPMVASVYDHVGARGGLFGGRKGSGKSRALWTLWKSWTHCRDVLFVAIDLSGGATSNPWLPCLHWRVTTAEDGERVLGALLDEATARADMLTSLGWESWRPSPEHPAVVVVIDEVQRMVKGNYGAQVLLDQLVQVDRKSGISVIVICPNPVGTDGITPVVRENSGVRLCFASTGHAVKYVLEGTPAFAESYRVAEFDQPGQVLGYGVGLLSVPGRAFDTDLAEATRVAVEHAQFRPSPDGLLTATLRAAGRGERPGPGPGAGVSAPDPQPTPAPAGPAADPALFATLRDMANGPAPFGRAWPTPPDLPPTGRMSVKQALGVMAGMVRQQGGASPADMVMATGYSRQWVHKTLAQWEKDRLVANTERGRWEAVRVAA